MCSNTSEGEPVVWGENWAPNFLDESGTPPCLRLWEPGRSGVQPQPLLPAVWPWKSRLLSQAPCPLAICRWSLYGAVSPLLSNYTDLHGHGGPWTVLTFPQNP